jgi:rhodanese-related sulfurtransferase
MKRGFVATLLSLLLLGAVVAPVIAQDSSGEDLRVYLDPARLQDLIGEERPDAYVVDTRSQSEYVSGHIPGAVNIDYRVIGQNPPTDDRDALVIVYCLSGVRSEQAARSLRRLGFTRVLNWGGITRWPYETATGPDPFE